MLEKFRAAFNGCIYCLRTQINMGFHIAAAVIVLGLAWYFQVRAWEWAVLILTTVLVLAAEIINTAIEVTIDLCTDKQYNPLAKIAKDVAAGAVLVLALGAVVIGILIFGPRIGL